MVINISKHRPAVVLIVVVILLLCVIALLYKSAQVVPEREAPKAKPEKISPYGEFLTWEQVNMLFPKYSKATVIDFDTGLSFRVQRRGGTNHADIQPLTADDTTVMKAIYDGKWSWQRKAVIVQLDNGRRIAASMNGMPHGGGSIKNNNFNGHSCIHFRDSKTHGSRKVNMAHQIMVWKAANKVHEQLQTLTPKKTIEVFLAAVDQGELNIAARVLDADTKDAALLLDALLHIESIRVYRIEQMEQNSYKVCIGVVHQDSCEAHTINLELELSQNSDSAWIIKSRTLLPLLLNVGDCC